MTRAAILLLIVTFVLLGCGNDAPPPPPAADSIDKLIEDLTAMRDDTKAAAEFETPDVKGADLAASVATAAWNAHLNTLDDIPTDDPQLSIASDLTRQTVRWAKIANERKRLNKDLNGLVARTYRTGRGAGIAAVFKSLGFAAGQVAKHGPDNLPDAVVSSAEIAATFAQNVTRARLLPDGSTDWAAIADDMNAYAADPPPVLRQLIALAWMGVGQNGVALAELETIDANTLQDPRHRASHHLLRGLLYRLRGYPTLGGVEMETVAEFDEQLGEFGPELQSGAYLIVAASAIYDGRYVEADKMIADAVRIWPNNPVAVYLTGERLAETGERTAAAESLEKLAAETEWSWLAEKVTARARQMRDGEHRSEPLINDPSFLRQLAIRYVLETAKSSETAAKMGDLLEATQSLGKRLVDKIPGLGGEPDEAE